MLRSTEYQSRPRATSAVAIDQNHLRLALALRGWSFRDLMKVTGIGTNTVAAINAGRPVSAKDFQKICKALSECPVDPMAETLLGRAQGATCASLSTSERSGTIWSAYRASRRLSKEVPTKAAPSATVEGPALRLSPL